MTHKSHVKLISFNATMLNGSCGEEGETALQRAVAAGKKETLLASLRVKMFGMFHFFSVATSISYLWSSFLESHVNLLPVVILGI